MCCDGSGGLKLLGSTILGSKTRNSNSLGRKRRGCDGRERGNNECLRDKTGLNW